MAFTSRCKYCGRVSCVGDCDGLAGTDQRASPPPTNGSNVFDLFKRGALPPDNPDSSQAAMVDMLERLATEVVAGRTTGIAIVCLQSDGKFLAGTFGRGAYTEFLGGVEDLKLEIYSEHKAQQQRKPWK